MTEDEFRAAMLAIMLEGSPSADDNLLGMEMDFFIRLGELDEISDDSVTVNRTEQAERLIRASCEPAVNVSLAVVVDAIRRQWLTNLRYGYREASFATVGDEAATFDFATQIAPRGLYVTGQVEVRRPD